MPLRSNFTQTRRWRAARSSFAALPVFFCVALFSAESVRGQLPSDFLFTFNDGVVPPGTTVRGNNPGVGVTNRGGLGGTGCMVLTRPASGETYGHWAITNDLGFGNMVDAFEVRFALYTGNGSGGNAGVPNAGGNGMVLHIGPVPPVQYTGSASSWGNGLDVGFRTYNSGVNTAGINIGYDAVSDVFRPGAGTLIAKTNFLGYFQTNKPSLGFELPTWVWLVVTNSRLSLVCSNVVYGGVMVYTNLELPGYIGMTPFHVTFTASDGAGAHQDAWIDEVLVRINRQAAPGAPQFSVHPSNQLAREGDTVWFTACAQGAPPIAYQWFSNGVAIPGATSANYTSAPVIRAMDRATYWVVASNAVGVVMSRSAALRVLPAICGALVWSDEFDGTVINSNKWERMGDYARQQGYWMKEDSYLSGHGQLVLRVKKDALGRFTAGAVRTKGRYERTFGYFEAKVKFPTQQGHWCAFWLMTMSQGRIGDEGRDGTEIDIMEKAWLTDRIQHALHWDGYGEYHQTVYKTVRGMGMNDGGWHIFSLDWSPTQYVFYVDGVATWRTNAGGVSQVPQYIKLTEEIGNFGIGEDAWGVGPISNAVLPDYYFVEYVRVYDPCIIAQPRSASASVGTQVRFTVGVSGAPPFFYQWLSNGAPILGATGASYTTPPVATNMDGTVYSVIVSNASGVVLSSNAILRVLPCVSAGGNWFLLGSNLGCWGTNANGTVNDPFMNNSTVRAMASAVIGVMRFPCRSFTSNQLRSIAATIRNAGIEPLAILTAKNLTNALAQLDALKDLVTLYEFGNENDYFDGWSGATYGVRWSNDIPVLRKAAPWAQFGGPVGSHFDANGSAYMRDFLNAVRDYPDLWPDFVSMHYYSGHGGIPAWTATRILANVQTNMIPGLERLNTDIETILGVRVPLAITEWNYDAVPEANTNTLDMDVDFMNQYTALVLGAFKSKGVWMACQYDFAGGAGGGRLDMVTTSGMPKPQYNAFLDWQGLNAQRGITITVQPQSVVIAAGSKASFGVVIATSTITPVRFEWWQRKPGESPELVASNSGCIFASAFLTRPVWGADSGTEYYATISNPVSAVTSAVATVTVPTARLDVPAILDGTNLVLSWTGGGLLLWATNLTGPWLIVPNAASPFTNPVDPSMQQQFFRIQQ